MSVEGSAINNEKGSEPGSTREGSNAAFKQINKNMGKVFEVLQNMGEALNLVPQEKALMLPLNR